MIGADNFGHCPNFEIHSVCGEIHPPGSLQNLEINLSHEGDVGKRVLQGRLNQIVSGENYAVTWEKLRQRAKLLLTATSVANSMHRFMQLASSQVFVSILTALWLYEKLPSPTGWPAQRELVEGDSPWNPATRTPHS